jgi:peroxiredoxin (alkyl hydroperoxide reductase subunit C)
VISVDEIKRTLITLQTATENKCSMPLNWKPGDRVILPTPKTVEALEERIHGDLEMVDFYLATETL